MEAMILAAGFGTRLLPLTNEVPKALIDVGGVPMLERVARRLIDAGADRLIINVHHRAEQVMDFVRVRHGFGVDTRFSLEEEKPLETGGGLKKAEPLFLRQAPFFLHNVDMISDIALGALFEAHLRSDALATLAVQPAVTNRFLLFDEHKNLCGYGDREGNEHITRPPSGITERLDFCGVHVISPRIFDLMTESGVFSVTNTYLRLAREGEKIRPYRVDGASVIDIGSHEQLEKARTLFS